MKINDSNTPLHLLRPDYSIPYQIPKENHIVKKLLKVLEFLEKSTPSNLENNLNNKKIGGKVVIDENTIIPKSQFRLTSYEWGVTYAGLLQLGEITGIEKFSNYTKKRLKLISDLSQFYLNNKENIIDEKSTIYSVVNPAALDDAGAICASMIKAELFGLDFNIRPLIDNFINYISKKQYRFSDGTLARNRPYKNTLWLDDLFMSVPALALMGKITNNKLYFDDATKQVLQFSKLMFEKENGLYFHGWVEKMNTKPKFYWARANGWAVMALVELLTVLPKNHRKYSSVLDQFKNHLNGLISFQSGSGFWHQLINRTDSYLETSATAIITYSICKAINEGLIDKLAFAPIAILGWNAISTKINNSGQIEGTCVGTGMGFDSAFYYHRPVNKFAAHGYGTMFLAGAEIIRLLQNNKFSIVEGSIQLEDN
ncbi:MAG: glycoside hydrolase family 88 protein [Ignavibacteriae bacterium]|nr:glycoside hydrolase family 88 protein [Ignavibacteriota bacterium]